MTAALIPWPAPDVTDFVPAGTLSVGLLFRPREPRRTGTTLLILPARPIVAGDDIQALGIPAPFLARAFPVPQPGRLLFDGQAVAGWLQAHCTAAGNITTVRIGT